MCRIALGESGAKQSQDDKPLTHQRLVRTASVDIAPGAICRFAVAAGEKSPQLGRCFRDCLPPRTSPLGLSDSGGALMWPLLVTPSPIRGAIAPEDLNQAAKAGPRYHAKWLIASGRQVRYMSASASPAKARLPRPSPEEPKNPGAPPSRSGVFASRALPSQQQRSPA